MSRRGIEGGAIGYAPLGVVRLLAYLGWTLLLVPLQTLALALRLPLRKRLPLLFHRGCLRIFDLQLVVVGEVSRQRPTLFISNHSSYLDIEVLGAVLEGSFIAKQEVAGWPLFGFLAKLQETVFVNRQARHQAGHQNASLADRLAAGDNLILFPEGTSSDGNRVLPFKTALFGVAGQRIGGEALTLQPVSVTAVALDGIPLGRLMRPLYAWYGDMDLGPHLWQVAKLGGIGVVVEFHPPVTVASFGSRKALAEHCFREISAGVARAVAGRHDPLAKPASRPA